MFELADLTETVNPWKDPSWNLNGNYFAKVKGQTL